MKAKKFSLGLLVPPEGNDDSFREGIAIILLSDRTLKSRFAYYMAANAGQSGKDISMLFSLKGLKWIQKPGFSEGAGFSSRAAGERRGFLDQAIPPYPFLKSSDQRAFLHMLKQEGLKPLPRIYQMVAEVGMDKLPGLEDVYHWAVEVGVKMLPCQNSMERFHFHPSSLREQVAAPVCTAAYIREVICTKLIFVI
jgi:predicted peroxiredoxin